MMTQNFEKQEIKRFLFYGDILVVGIFVIALALLVRDAYFAGWYMATGNTAEHTRNLWYMARETAFLTASLAWIFVRFFKDKLQSLNDPWR